MMIRRLYRFCLAAIVASIASTTAADAEERAVADWSNSLQMAFVELEPGVLMCIWETRVSDYQGFVEATGLRWSKPYFEQTDNEPAVYVSWEDANLFCRWLTRSEQEAELIGEGDFYRLPTEAEWLAAAGVVVDESKKSRTSFNREIAFPWGKEWPPPEGSGNYGQQLQIDGFEQTAPVGSFSPNELGFYDMGGNVWEWCSDYYEGAPDMRVLKGGSWRMHEPSDMMHHNRVGNISYIRLPVYGFRVVLDRTKSLEPTKISTVQAER
ncbi:MAG: SUMF1/EgtB/PvdO family nonheme iron enzyme [Verrucomicrobiota bacterium]